MAELEQRKIEAEITHLQAQTAKATAEAAKLEDDRRSSRRSFGYWCVETVKVVGAVILGVGGIIATITGYQLAEVKKERTELAIEKGEKKIQETSQLFEAAIKKKNELDTALTVAQGQFDTMQKALEKLQSQLVSFKQSSPAGSDVAVLDTAIARTQEIKGAASTAEGQLRFARTEDTAQKQAIQQDLTGAKIAYADILDTRDQGPGYVVVLGSYKKIEDAVRNVKAFRAKSISREVKLYYAINDYYAAALGIIGSRDAATNTMKAVRSMISDAYIFSSAAFPYEIKLKEP